MYRLIGADGREYGPVDADQVRRWILEGRAVAASRARLEGASEWKPLAQFSEFSDPLARGSTRAPIYVPLRRTSSYAVAGLVLGLLSFAGFCCFYGIPFNLLGLIFSVLGLSQAQRYPEIYEGKGIAIAGLVLSILSLLAMGALFLWMALGQPLREPRFHWHRFST